MSSLRKSILIVEDDLASLELLGIAIKKTETFDSVILASDGLEASLKLNNQKFDLILLDINVPKKNAISILSTIKTRSDWDANKIIILSGEIDKEKLDILISFGIKNYLVKPLSLEKLKEMINKIIPLKRY